MGASIKKFAGKKLLLLGTNTSTIDMLNYARSQGAYVIVTDNLPPEKSAAKLIADEAWPVSTDDVDTMEKLAIQNKVNGISAGASEFNLERVLTLCERLGLPFYCNRKQWDTCSNKQLFKQLCRDNGIPVTEEYHFNGNYREEDLSQIKYPVIVKPVDRSAGIGIRVCQNESELLKAYQRAISSSKTQKAIIEEYIDGNEFIASYTVKDGEFSLSLISDRYFHPTIPETIPLSQANTYPSKYIDKYLEELNGKVIKMFQSVGIANGFIFVQGFISNGDFRIFEANYRLSGSPWYMFTSRINHINYMEMLVNYSLTGKMDNYNLSLDNPKLDNKYGCILVRVSKGGRVGKILGLEEITSKKSLVYIEKGYDVGDYIEKSGTLSQTHFRFYIIEDTLQELKNSIKEIQETVKVLDDKGNDMLMPPFNTDRI